MALVSSFARLNAVSRWVKMLGECIRPCKNFILLVYGSTILLFFRFYLCFLSIHEVAPEFSAENSGPKKRRTFRASEENSEQYQHVVIVSTIQF